VVGNETGFRSEGMNHLRLIDRWAHQMRDEFFRSEGMDHLRLIVKPLIGRSGLFCRHMRTNQRNCGRKRDGFSKRRDEPPPSNRPLGTPNERRVLSKRRDGPPPSNRQAPHWSFGFVRQPHEDEPRERVFEAKGWTTSVKTPAGCSRSLVALRERKGFHQMEGIGGQVGRSESILLAWSVSMRVPWLLVERRGVRMVLWCWRGLY
jgi:hypothetical protein